MLVPPHSRPKIGSQRSYLTRGVHKKLLSAMRRGQLPRQNSSVHYRSIMLSRLEMTVYLAGSTSNCAGQRALVASAGGGIRKTGTGEGGCYVHEPGVSLILDVQRFSSVPLGHGIQAIMPRGRVWLRVCVRSFRNRHTTFVWVGLAVAHNAPGSLVISGRARSPLPDCYCNILGAGPSLGSEGHVTLSVWSV